MTANTRRITADSWQQAKTRGAADLPAPVAEVTHKKAQIASAANDEERQNASLFSNLPLPALDSTGRGPRADNAQKSGLRVGGFQLSAPLFFSFFFCMFVWLFVCFGSTRESTAS